MTRTLAVALLLAVLAAVWQWREATAADGRAQAAESQRDVALGRLQAEQAARALDMAERRIEHARAKRLQENLDAERLARLDVEASARRAVAADVGLRGELARLASRARAASADSAAAGEREAALATVPVLAGLLQQCSERRTELARFADESRLAGKTCERAYDALDPETPELRGLPQQTLGDPP